MTSVNEIQIGGDHYKSTYQHWDLVVDTGMPYLIGCTTKYVARWRKKNGKQDLEKANHYISKAKERGVFFQNTPTNMRLVEFFTEKNLTDKLDVDLFLLIVNGNYIEAESKLCHMIIALENKEGEATPEYVNQDR